jgi:hypothetical protein
VLRLPSISTNGKNADQLNRCAEWLAKKLRSIGLDAESVRTEKYPIVWGRSPYDARKRTVLIYGHYDVQSPEPLELWDSPPFEPVLQNGRVFARGVPTFAYGLRGVAAPGLKVIGPKGFTFGSLWGRGRQSNYRTRSFAGDPAYSGRTYRGFRVLRSSCTGPRLGARRVEQTAN